MNFKQLRAITLSICLLSGSVIAGETVPMPAPPPPGTAVKKIHAPKAEKKALPLNVFDLLSIVLSNLGILQ